MRKIRTVVSEFRAIRHYCLMFPRIFGLHDMLVHSSVFLLGPRQTGKSTLLRILFPRAKFYDLLEADTLAGWQHGTAAVYSLRRTVGRRE
jgi:predicted AAA+ superfamily ATPase